MTAIHSNQFTKTTTIQIFTIFMMLLLPSVQALSCLVIKPGYGLISERCSPFSVACRVRIENDAIVWYTSKLYDRNHLACVMRNEYGSRERSGCVKKSSGSVRCWCYGQSNCNNPQNMIKLYDAFKLNDQSVLDEVIDEIETSDTDDYEGETGMETTSAGRTSQKVSKTSLNIPEKSILKVETKSSTTPSSSSPSSISVDFDKTNRSLQKQQNYDSKMMKQMKATTILPLINDHLNKTTMEQSPPIQNERKIRRKELVGSGITALGDNISILLNDIIALLIFVLIMF